MVFLLSDIKYKEFGKTANERRKTREIKDGWNEIWYTIYSRNKDNITI